ncbi:hypothetical protein ACFL59_00855 [Planctomycetota bacterium]
MTNSTAVEVEATERVIQQLQTVVRAAMTRDPRRAGNIVRVPGTRKLLLEDLEDPLRGYMRLLQTFAPVTYDGTADSSPAIPPCLLHSPSEAPRLGPPTDEKGCEYLQVEPLVARMAEIDNTTWHLDPALKGFNVHIPRVFLDDLEGLRVTLGTYRVEVTGVPDGNRLVLHAVKATNVAGFLAEVEPIVLELGDPAPTRNVYVERTLRIDRPERVVHTLQTVLSAAMVRDPARSGKALYERGSQTIVIRDLASRLPGHERMLRSALAVAVGRQGRAPEAIHPALGDRPRSAPPPFLPEMPKRRPAFR